MISNKYPIKRYFVNLVHLFERYIIPLVIFRLSLDTHTERRERGIGRERDS